MTPFLGIYINFRYVNLHTPYVSVVLRPNDLHRSIVAGSNNVIKVSCFSLRMTVTGTLPIHMMFPQKERVDMWLPSQGVVVIHIGKRTAYRRKYTCGWAFSVYADEPAFHVKSTPTKF